MSKKQIELYQNYENKLNYLIYFISKSGLKIEISNRNPFGTIYLNNNLEYIIDCTDDNYMLYKLSDKLMNNLCIDWKNYIMYNDVHFKGQFETPSDLIKAYYKVYKLQ